MERDPGASDAVPEEVRVQSEDGYHVHSVLRPHGSIHQGQTGEQRARVVVHVSWFTHYFARYFLQTSGICTRWLDAAQEVG